MSPNSVCEKLLTKFYWAKSIGLAYMLVRRIHWTELKWLSNACFSRFAIIDWLLSELRVIFNCGSEAKWVFDSRALLNISICIIEVSLVRTVSSLFPESPVKLQNSIRLHCFQIAPSSDGKHAIFWPKTLPKNPVKSTPIGQYGPTV